MIHVRYHDYVITMFASSATELISEDFSGFGPPVTV